MNGATPVPGPIIITGVVQSFGKLTKPPFILHTKISPSCIDSK